MTKTLELSELIHHAWEFCPSDLDPLKKYLDSDFDVNSKDKYSASQSLADEIKKLGGNSILNAMRGSGVPYPEIVYDVGIKLKAPDIRETNSVEINEQLLLQKITSDAFDQMSSEEQAEFLKSFGFKNQDFPTGIAGTMLVQLILKQYGGFAIYRMAVILANIVAKAVLGSGLGFATNIAITRTVGAFLGPIGWIATGAWLAADLAGPAFRKTIPIVIHIAMLRLKLINRVDICVVGDGATGKDSLMKSVFNASTNISPIAGSTTEVETFQPHESEPLYIHNLPGFNDTNHEVNIRVCDFIRHADIFIAVIDINRGASQVDVRVMEAVSKLGRPIIVCLNKVDLPKPSELDLLVKNATEKLDLTGDITFIQTAFDPRIELSPAPIGIANLKATIQEILISKGKTIEYSFLK